MLVWLFLVLALAAYALFLSPRPAQWLGIGHRRIARFRFWLIRAWLLFGGVSIVALLALRQVDAIGTLPAIFTRAAVQFDIYPGGYMPDLPTLGYGLGGLAIGAAIGVIVARIRRRRNRRPFSLGDVSSVLPAHRGEIGWVAMLAVTAGITEELFFRLLLPLLIATASGIPALGFILSALLFAFAHRYQGWAGVVATLGLAALFTAIYLGTGSLWPAMLTHALIDLNSLVLRPMLLGLPPRPTIAPAVPPPVDRNR